MIIAFNPPAILNQSITFPAEVDARGPIPQTAVFQNLQNVVNRGFTFRPVDLLHAIGSKTAALPSSKRDRCLLSAALFVEVLEYNGVTLAFGKDIDSDTQTSRSLEIGIGMMCLVAGNCFAIPWDQLQSIRGRGKRFDYRAVNTNLKCIFEAKGTKYLSKQAEQIASGLEKKKAHKDRGENVDVAVIISTRIGKRSGKPRIVIADPDIPISDEAFGPASDMVYRYRHYARIMQFAGSSLTARSLYLESERILGRDIGGIKERRPDPNLIRLQVGDAMYVGTRTLRSGAAIRDHREQQSSLFPEVASDPTQVQIFQGIREDVYETIVYRRLEELEIPPGVDEAEVNRTEPDAAVSVFSDGSVLMIEPV